MAHKKELRQIYKDKRNSLDYTDVEKYSDDIYHKFVKIDLSYAEYVHIFLPIARFKEVNTYPILGYLFSDDKKVVVPKVNQHVLDTCLVEEGFQTKLNFYKIPEPIDYTLVDPGMIDAIIMPLFICDTKGNRVGYGGGYYDRLLELCRKDVVKIGVNYYEPLENIVEGILPTDVPLDYLVTPKGIVSFKDLK